MPCILRLISSVTIEMQGELLTQYKLDFELLVRLRLRNDLSMILHEERSRADFYKEINYDFKNMKARERADVTCFVWTVGKSGGPIASVFVECTLSGWGSYRLGLWDKFNSKHLGHAPPKEMRDHVDGMIRDAIARISSEFLEARDQLAKPP